MKDFNSPSRVNPPDSFQDKILDLAANGYSKQGCAHHFGVSLPTFNRWLEESDAFVEAFARGRERERQSLHNMLYRAAIEGGNPSAAMFLLKARHGYREGDQADQSNRVIINFALPGAMTAEQYRTIEAVAGKNQKREAKHAD